MYIYSVQEFLLKVILLDTWFCRDDTDLNVFMISNVTFT